MSKLPMVVGMEATTATETNLNRIENMNYTEALNKFTTTSGVAADLARAGKYADAATMLLKMGVRGDYWRACRQAAGLAYDDATNDALMAELIAAKKSRFKK